MNLLVFTTALGIASGFLQVLGYWEYVKKLNLGKIRPNTASWSIWAFGAILESSSYIFATGDWVKNILPTTCAICAILIFLYCLRQGHFERLTKFEWFLVIMDSIAIFIWWYSSAVYVNIFLVITAAISFIPIFKHVWVDPKAEDALPWYIWTAAYTLLGTVVILRWEKWEDLVYPIMFATLHLIVAMLALDSRIPNN